MGASFASSDLLLGVVDSKRLPDIGWSYSPSGAIEIEIDVPHDDEGNGDFGVGRQSIWELDFKESEVPQGLTSSISSIEHDWFGGDDFSIISGSCVGLDGVLGNVLTVGPQMAPESGMV